MNNYSLETSLLGIISTQPMHGYEIYKKFSNLSGIGVVWKIKIGRLYSILNKFESDGLIKAGVKKIGNRPARNEYSITPKGERIFLTWLKTPVQYGRDFRINFLLKIFFSSLKGNDFAIQIINSQIEVCEKWLESKNKIQENKLNGIDFEETNFNYLVNQYRLIQTKGYIEWLIWCKKKFERG